MITQPNVGGEAIPKLSESDTVEASENKKVKLAVEGDEKAEADKSINEERDPK